jgi:hypothetical protein
VAIAASVVVVDAADRDAEATEIGPRHQEKLDRRLMRLSGKMAAKLMRQWSL